jgi:hypothetical protein
LNDKNSLLSDRTIWKTELNVKKKPQDMELFIKPLGEEPDKKLSHWDNGNQEQQEQQFLDSHCITL